MAHYNVYYKCILNVSPKNYIKGLLDLTTSLNLFNHKVTILYTLPLSYSFSCRMISTCWLLGGYLSERGLCVISCHRMYNAMPPSTASTRSHTILLLLPTRGRGRIQIEKLLCHGICVLSELDAFVEDDVTHVTVVC